MGQKRLKFWGLLGVLLLIPCNTAMGQCAIPNMLKGDITTDVRKPWYVQDEGKVWIVPGNARSNSSPDFLLRMVGSFSKWNALHQSVSLLANKGYALTASVRTSSNMRDGYMGFRGMGLPKPVETKFGPLPALTALRVPFTPARAGSYDVFIGYWALEKPLPSERTSRPVVTIEMGDVRLEPLSGGCEDVITKPGQQ